MKILKEELKKLVGKDIVQLVYNKFSINLVFDNGELNIESEYTFTNSNDRKVSGSFPIKECDNLFSIIGEKITSANQNEDNSLTLTFSDNSKLEVSGFNNNNESYLLLIEGEQYVV